MIRFRFVEDEKRYLSLIAEVYRLLASHLPAPAVQLAMRNLGKAQDMLMLDGVRQGLALAELSLLDPHAYEQAPRNTKAFQVHALIYGSADTPLRDMELECLDKLGLPADTAEHAWLDNKPMRFAPTTYRAWQAEQVKVQLSPQEPTHVLHEESDDAPPIPPPASDLDQDDTQERPALLDQAREVLQKLVKEGYQPGAWSEMIMRLHLIMKIDAGFLDIQMASEMGRTVLAQCGIHDIFPGRGVNLEEMKKMGEGSLDELISGDGSTETS